MDITRSQWVKIAAEISQNLETFRVLTSVLNIIDLRIITKVEEHFLRAHYSLSLQASKAVLSGLGQSKKSWVNYKLAMQSFEKPLTFTLLNYDSEGRPLF